MPKSKRYLKIFLHIISVLCWIAAIIPVGYVLYQAFGSMDGTIHGFNGEMLYGMAAFTDTILIFPLFLLWVFCLLIAIISTVGILYIRKHS